MIALAIALGVFAGLGGFTFWYGGGVAYFGDDPSACAQCHVMRESFDSWQSSGHRHVAVCNDCHLPPGFVGKWLTKADNGMLHALAFTTDRYPDPIRIKSRNARRTQLACLSCHDGLLHALESPAARSGRDGGPPCAHCHADAGHALR